MPFLLPTYLWCLCLCHFSKYFRPLTPIFLSCFSLFLPVISRFVSLFLFSCSTPRPPPPMASTWGGFHLYKPPEKYKISCYPSVYRVCNVLVFCRIKRPFRGKWQTSSPSFESSLEAWSWASRSRLFCSSRTLCVFRSDRLVGRAYGDGFEEPLTGWHT
jgi:hypothetical protein